MLSVHLPVTVPNRDRGLGYLCQNLTFMAKSSTRRVTIYINGKEVEASVKQIREEMNRLTNEQNRMVIGVVSPKVCNFRQI